MITAAICFVGFLVTWGGYKEKVDYQKKRLDASIGKLDKQAHEDTKLKEALSVIQATCSGRKELFDRNDKDHIEMFSRINALETGMAALPGKLADRMQEQFEKWRSSVKSDIDHSHAETKKDLRNALSEWIDQNAQSIHHNHSSSHRRDKNGD